MLENKNAHFFSQKLPKIWHFLWKTCYFRIKNAHFSKWCIISTYHYWKCIHRICSSLEIYFGFFKVKTNHLRRQFLTYYDFKKLQKNCSFVRFSDFPKNELEKWILCMISNLCTKLMRMATHLIFFFQWKLKVHTFWKKAPFAVSSNAGAQLK